MKQQITNAHCKSVSQRGLAVLAAFTMLGGAASVAHAGFTVDVGYADDIRPSPFFPNPWKGNAGVIFEGDATPGNIDTGAIKINNTGPGSIAFNSMTVDGFGNGASFNLWSAQVIPAGESLILIQTSGQNFDSSDQVGNPAAIPQVHLTIDGTLSTFADTAQVLNTEGTDHLAAAGLNESHQWRPIGTFGGQGGVPETSGWSVLAFAALGLMGFSRFTRKSANA
jgi:hypothetical protein